MYQLILAVLIGLGIVYSIMIVLITIFLMFYGEIYPRSKALFLQYLAERRVI
jgi:hypothetical protein